MTKGIIFDYGGTLDTNSLHWSEVLWEGYQTVGIPVGKDQFRLSYVHAERELAKHPYVEPRHTYLDLLRIKVEIETRHLVGEGYWKVEEAGRQEKAEAVAQYCYGYVWQVLRVSRPVVEALSQRYPLVLVSNFYGNLHSVLRDFRMEYFKGVIESAVVGVRKPDPAIFRLGIEALHCRAGETVVVGDSYGKDIVPAHALGCQTVWMKGRGWSDEPVDETLPTWTLTDISQLPSLFKA